MTEDDRRDAERAIAAARDILRTAQAVNAEAVEVARTLKNDIAEAISEIIGALEVGDYDSALDMLKTFRAFLKTQNAIRNVH
jgi:DNA-binding PucR family transcriptional regulator